MGGHMARALAFVLLSLGIVPGRAYAGWVDLDVTSPFSYGDTINVFYYIDAGPTCDTIEGSISGSSGY
jgi:hypothetical protein